MLTITLTVEKNCHKECIFSIKNEYIGFENAIYKSSSCSNWRWIFKDLFGKWRWLSLHFLFTIIPTASIRESFVINLRRAISRLLTAAPTVSKNGTRAELLRSKRTLSFTTSIPKTPFYRTPPKNTAIFQLSFTCCMPFSELYSSIPSKENCKLLICYLEMLVFYSSGAFNILLCKQKFHMTCFFRVNIEGIILSSKK